MVTRLYLVIKNTRCYKYLTGKMLALVCYINSCIWITIRINQRLIIITLIHAIIGTYVIIFIYVSDYNKSI